MKSYFVEGSLDRTMQVFWFSGFGVWAVLARLGPFLRVSRGATRAERCVDGRRTFPHGWRREKPLKPFSIPSRFRHRDALLAQTGLTGGQCGFQQVQYLFLSIAIFLQPWLLCLFANCALPRTIFFGGPALWYRLALLRRERRGDVVDFGRSRSSVLYCAMGAPGIPKMFCCNTIVRQKVQVASRVVCL